MVSLRQLDTSMVLVGVAFVPLCYIVVLVCVKIMIASAINHTILKVQTTPNSLACRNRISP